MPKAKQFLKDDFRKKKPGKAAVVSDVGLSLKESEN